MASTAMATATVTGRGPRLRQRIVEIRGSVMSPLEQRRLGLADLGKGGGGGRGVGGGSGGQAAAAAAAAAAADGKQAGDEIGTKLETSSTLHRTALHCSALLCSALQPLALGWAGWAGLLCASRHSLQFGRRGVPWESDAGSDWAGRLGPVVEGSGGSCGSRTVIGLAAWGCG
jgi:hypothetical protein